MTPAIGWAALAVAALVAVMLFARLAVDSVGRVP